MTFDESLGQLATTLHDIETADVTSLRQFLTTDTHLPLITLGSGGAFPALKYCAMLYTQQGTLGSTITPFLLSSYPDSLIQHSKTLLMSKSGRGKDTEYVAKRITTLNPKQAFGVTRHSSSKENKLAGIFEKNNANYGAYEWTDSDGFIYSTSTVATFALMYRAFTGESDIVRHLPTLDAPAEAFAYHTRDHECPTPLLGDIKHFMVLYGAYGESVAADFESRMIESGIASVQLCDYRNFCHGRFIFSSMHTAHHRTTKEGETIEMPTECAIVMLLTPAERAYAESLIYGKDLHQKDDLFPAHLPIVTISTEHTSPLATLDLLIRTMQFFAKVADSYYAPINNLKGVRGIKDPHTPYNPNKIDKTTPINLNCQNYTTRKK